MRVEFIAQPNAQVGKLLTELLRQEPLPRQIIFVSAFVGLQTVIRIKHLIEDLRDRHANVRFVIGIDMGGTSREVLRELISWNVEVVIIKHRAAGHTFHPKIYCFEWNDQAEIIIGSNNLTEGGFFRNYEGAAKITYDFPADSQAYQSAQTQLARFITPTGPVAYSLTPTFLEKLIAANALPTEGEARRNTEALHNAGVQRSTGAQTPLFGTERIDQPPPLPVDLLERLVHEVRRRRQMERAARNQRARSGRPRRPISASGENALSPAAFYMTLPTLQGSNIPGEARIPLEAIELAAEFWGWPDEYERDVSPRAGQHREYWNWRPRWRVWNVEKPELVITQAVRMYMYTNSSDFRFYARPLVNAGADLGDVVRIRRIAEPDAEYECVLARTGTPNYNEWLSYCTQLVRGSTRRFGYG